MSLDEITDLPDSKEKLIKKYIEMEKLPRLPEEVRVQFNTFVDRDNATANNELEKIQQSNQEKLAALNKKLIDLVTQFPQVKLDDCEEANQLAKRYQDFQALLASLAETNKVANDANQGVRRLQFKFDEITRLTGLGNYSEWINQQVDVLKNHVADAARVASCKAACEEYEKHLKERAKKILASSSITKKRKRIC